MGKRLIRGRIVWILVIIIEDKHLLRISPYQLVKRTLIAMKILY